MSNTININIQVDSDLKKKAEEIYSELGLDLSAAINIFLRSSVRNGGIPIDLCLDTYNDETLSAIEDATSGDRLSNPFDSVSSLMEELNS